MKNQAGQVILILILVMTVGLAIGLSIVQKSLVDVSTASRVEQSSRAFSAAEAGIEKGLQSGNCGDNCVDFSENSSKASVSGTELIPCIPGSGSCAQLSGQQQVALELPPLAKEDMAQIWLSDYTSSSNPPPAGYTQPALDIFWGNSETDKAALELTLVYFGTNPADTVDPSTSKYRSRKWYLDQTNRSNGFCQVSTCTGTGYPIGPNNYQCRFKLGDNTVSCANGTAIDNSSLPVSSPNILMLLRIRLLYNSTSQPIAIQGVGTCGTGCSLPAQAKSIISTGSAGETQRRINLFQLYKVVPPYFDYAIFSAGEINK